MILLSKSKLKVLLILVLAVSITASSAWYVSHAIPASGISSTIEPGSLADDCSYFVYRNSILTNDNTTLIKNCQTGANDFIGTSTDIALNSLFAYLATVPAPVPNTPSGTNGGATFTIVFGIGIFYINSPITINMPGAGGSANALSFRGQTQDKTMFFLRRNMNDDMFKIINIGNKFEVSNMKFSGTVQASGPSSAFDFTGASAEINFAHVEMRDFFTADIILAGTGASFNAFDDVWFIGSGKGVQITGTGYNDFRFTGCKFENTYGFQTNIGSVSILSIVGSVFDNAGVAFNNGGFTKFTLVGNLFYNARNPAIQFLTTGLGSLTNFQTLIEGNVFQTNTGTNVAVSLGDYVDGVTITGNSFVGYTSSSTVPITLTQTHQKLTTLVTGNAGMGASWVGFGVTEPAVPASTVDQQNTNPYPIKVYITGIGSGITAYKITDPSGTSQTITTTVALGTIFSLDPYAKIALTYTGSPTWNWYGEANLL